MITLENVLGVDGTRKNYHAKSIAQKKTLDGSHLVALPGLIDPHVHFRTPGEEHKENWVTAARAAVKGGYTQVFDMPNNQPPCITKTRFQAKKALINEQLAQAGVPLRYELYLGADKNHFHEIDNV